MNRYALSFIKSKMFPNFRHFFVIENSFLFRDQPEPSSLDTGIY